MVKLLQVIAYNLAKSSAARDGNKKHRKNFRPRQIKLNHPVLVRITLPSHLKPKTKNA